MDCFMDRCRRAWNEGRFEDARLHYSMYAVLDRMTDEDYVHNYEEEYV